MRTFISITTCLALSGCAAHKANYQHWAETEQVRLKEQGKTDRAMIEKNNTEGAEARKAFELQLPYTTITTATGPYESVNQEGEHMVIPGKTITTEQVDTGALAQMQLGQVALELARGKVGNRGRQQGTSRILYSQVAPPKSEAAEIIRAGGEVVGQLPWKEALLGWFTADTIKGVAGTAGQVGHNVIHSNNDQSSRVSTMTEVMEP